jgi:hypothetical protein
MFDCWARGSSSTTEKELKDILSGFAHRVWLVSAVIDVPNPMGTCLKLLEHHLKRACLAVFESSCPALLVVFQDSANQVTNNLMRMDQRGADDTKFAYS